MCFSLSSWISSVSGYGSDVSLGQHVHFLSGLHRHMMIRQLLPLSSSNTLWATVPCSPVGRTFWLVLVYRVEMGLRVKGERGE